MARCGKWTQSVDTTTTTSMAHESASSTLPVYIIRLPVLRVPPLSLPRQMCLFVCVCQCECVCVCVYPLGNRCCHYLGDCLVLTLLPPPICEYLLLATTFPSFLSLSLLCLLPQIALTLSLSLSNYFNVTLHVVIREQDGARELR